MRVLMCVIAVLVATPPAAGGPKAGGLPAGGETIAQQTLRSAVEKGLHLLVRTSPTFIKTGGCNSCHNQLLPSAAQAFARRRGIAVGPTLEQISGDLSEATAERYLEYSVGGGGGIAALGYELFARALSSRPADARVRAQLHFIRGQQEPEGYWRGAVARLPGGPVAARPPLGSDDFTPTAFMIHALNTYAEGDSASTKARVEKARKWLLNTRADRTQEHAFRLLGLRWSGAPPGAVLSAMRDLQKLQRHDGGWSQMPRLSSDAYATGIALYALHEAGMSPTDKVYVAGLRYLLSTQAVDGTWHVRSRAIEFQPYFESGYPYGRDQWISAAGTAYATMAIAAAVAPALTSTRIK